MHARAAATGAIVFLGLVVAVAGLTWVSYARSESAVRAALRDDLEHLAVATAAVIDAASLEGLTDPAMEGSETYLDVHRPLAAVLRAVHTLRFVYTARLRDGRVEYVVDATPPGDADADGQEDHSPLGSIEAEPDAALLTALHTGAVTSNAEPHDSAWGRLVSGYAPVLRDGQVVAVVGVDITADTYTTVVRDLQVHMAVGAAGGVLTAALVGLMTAFAVNGRLALAAQREASELRLRQLLEALPDDLARLTADGRCIDASRGQLNLEDGGDEWFIGNHPRAGAGAHPVVAEAVDAVSKTGNSVVERAILPDGRVIELTLTRVGAEVIAVQRDVTAQAHADQAEREARSAEASALAARTRFLTNMTHHVRTPLHGMLGMTELVLESDLDDEQRHCLNAVERSGRSLLRILDNILDLTRADAGEIRLRPQPTDLADLARSCANRARRLPGVEHRTLTVHCAGTRIAHVDAARVRQILDEVLSNALIHTTGDVTLDVSFEDNAVVFVVGDRGPGIASDKIAAANDPLATRTGFEQGLGLGLALANRLASYLGGALSIWSVMGSATRVEIHLPAPPVIHEEPALT